MVREYLGPFFDAIHAYFERCAAKGLLHEIEPSIATLGLIGVMGAHRDLYRLFTGQELDWSLEKSVPAYASFFLAALGHTPMGAVPLAGF
jgi:hypothetical protein